MILHNATISSLVSERSFNGKQDPSKVYCSQTFQIAVPHFAENGKQFFDIILADRMCEDNEEERFKYKQHLMQPREINVEFKSREYDGRMFQTCRILSIKSKD